MGGLGGLLGGLAGLANVFVQWQQLQEAQKMNAFNMKNATVQSQNIAIQQKNRDNRKERIQNSINGNGNDSKDDGYQDLKTL